MSRLELSKRFLQDAGLTYLIDTIIEKITQRYPDAYCLMSDEVYGDEDVDLEIYVPEEKVLEVDKFAHEVAFELTDGTDAFVLPMVASIECCPQPRGE